MVKEYLNFDEVNKLENAADNSRDRLLIHLLFRLGCRISEVLTIAVDDIDFSAGKVSIIHLKVRLQLKCRQCGTTIGLRHDYCPKCGTKNETNSISHHERRRQRTLPLDADTLVMIKEYLEQNGSIIRNGKRYLFGINRYRAWQIVRQCAQKAGLSDLRNPETGRTRGVSPHRLRDAFAVHAMKTDDSGEGMRLLQEHLGHASFNTTAKYRKIASEEHREWYHKLWNNNPSTDAES